MPTLRIHRSKPKYSNGKPNLIFVSCGDTFTSAIIVREAPESWLVQRRFKNERGNLWMEFERRIWKRDVGSYVWLTRDDARKYFKERRERWAKLRLPKRIPVA